MISVIVPVYKVEKYINKCVESILNQTYKDYELILVDDGSPDNCGQICDSWAKKDNRIKVIHKENGGLSDARNVAVEIAKGDYITFIDSDDFIECDYLRILYNLIMETNAEIASCCPNVFWEGETVARSGEEVHNSVLEPEEAFSNMLYEDKLTNSAWGKIYSRQLFTNVRYPKGKLYEDMYVTYKLIMKSNRIVCTNLKLYNYLIRKNSIIGTIDIDHQLDMLEGAREMYSYIEKNIPNILDAAIYKIFVSSMEIYAKCPVWGRSYKTLKERLWWYIKQYRFSVIKNNRSAIKYRVLALISLLGGKAVQCTYRFLARR